jgi:hypothetical protein
VECVLRELGFTSRGRMSGTSHEKWDCIRDGHKYVVTLDCHRGEVRAMDVKSMIGQAGVPSKMWWKTVQRC